MTVLRFFIMIIVTLGLSFLSHSARLIDGMSDLKQIVVGAAFALIGFGVAHSILPNEKP